MNNNFFNEYPYTDYHELNLSWVVQQIISLGQQLSNFVKINTIKYADPIQWNIATQYEANTVVIDENTGTAYLSVAPVPSGVTITNTDYWTPIFTLDLLSANQNITIRNDGSNVLSTFASITGDWLLWNSVLYKVIQDINVNEAYVIGYNITAYTVEDFIHEYITALHNITGVLDDLTTTDKSNLVAAINEVLSTLNTTTGDLSDLDTTDKTNLVSAINEVLATILDKCFWYNIKDYGMEPGDNIYDDLFELIHDHIYPNNGGIIYFPAGTYYLDFTIFIPDNTTFIGEGNSTVIMFDLTDTDFGCAFANGGSNITIKNMCVEIATNAPYPVRGALPNTIGIGDCKYDDTLPKRSHTYVRQSGNKNIYLENVNSLVSNYGIQIEPEDYGVENIFINNHMCPSGMFSMHPNGQTLKNVFAENIICDTVRLGQGDVTSKNINIDGLSCTQILAEMTGVNISNFEVLGTQGNRISGATHETATIYVSRCAKFTNGHVIRAASSVQTRLIDHPNYPEDCKLFLENINLDTSNPYPNAISEPNYLSIYHSNCNFNPYSGYETVTTLTVSAQVPTTCIFNANYNQSMISGLFSHNFGTNVSEKIGDINSNIINTDVVAHRGVGTAILYNYTDRTIPPEIANVYLNTSGEINIIRIAPSSNTYNCVTFQLIW